MQPCKVAQMSKIAKIADPLGIRVDAAKARQQRARPEKRPGKFRRRGACVMTAMADSLRRIWSAKSRSPRLTGRGASGSTTGFKLQENRFTSRVRDKFLELAELAHRTAPTVFVIALQLLR